RPPPRLQRAGQRAHPVLRPGAAAALARRPGGLPPGAAAAPLKIDKETRRRGDQETEGRGSAYCLLSPGLLFSLSPCLARSVWSCGRREIGYGPPHSRAAPSHTPSRPRRPESLSRVTAPACAPLRAGARPPRTEGFVHGPSDAPAARAARPGRGRRAGARRPGPAAGPGQDRPLPGFGVPRRPGPEGRRGAGLPVPPE